jgi:hypothetical protein
MTITTSGTTLTFNDATTQTTAGVTSITAGTGISSTGGLTPTISNSGVTSIVAGTGISISGATGAVTVTNTVTAGQIQYSLATRTTAYNSNGTPMVWNSTGSLTWTAPTGVTRVKATVIAGGGGCCNNSGAWGGTGGTAIGYYTVSPGTAYSITVGSGGAAGGAANGSAGSSSSFASFCSATGGGGGNFSSGTYGSAGAGTSGNISNTTNQGNAGNGTNLSQLPLMGAGFAGYWTGTDNGTSGINYIPTIGNQPGAPGVWAFSGGTSGAVLIEYVG